MIIRWHGDVAEETFFEDVILPFDKQIIDAIKKTGCLCSSYVCGKSARLLKIIAGSGVDAIETLSPPELAGDVDLAAHGKRWGSRWPFGAASMKGCWLRGAGRDRCRSKKVPCCRAADGGGYVPLRVGPGGVRGDG